MNAHAPITPPVGDCITETLLRYRDVIERALRYADMSHSFDHIVQGVLNGQYHFYPVSERTCIIMEVRDVPNWRFYHVFIAGGDLQEIRDYEPIIIENANRLGASKLTATGRPGFARVSAKHGWCLAHVHLVKDI